MSNALLEQYAIFKKQCLAKSPYRCLLDEDIAIDTNPHQIEAFCAAVHNLKNGGIILADEVGLGKTIEAGLILKYAISNGSKRILIAMPKPLLKQWEIELSEKFHINSTILTKYIVDHDYYEIKTRLEDSPYPQVVIVTYGYASRLMKRFAKVKWDILVVDEAHHLRNAFNGAKTYHVLYEISKGIPKIMLTATPIQNSLQDLHGIVSFIDDRIFGSQKVFNQRYHENGDYAGLQANLRLVMQRSLRRDVRAYMDFPKRECRDFDFQLSPAEIILYERVNDFLKRDTLYCLPASNRNMITLVIRKLLASSSFALVETFEVLKDRLEKLYEGTKSSDAREGFDLFWSYLEDEVDEDEFNQDDDDTVYQKALIQNELDAVNAIIEDAENIHSNAKMLKLQNALCVAFENQRAQHIPEKAVIFTESKRTQKYMRQELIDAGYDEEDIVLFNGEMSDEFSKRVYRTWMTENYGKTNYGRDVEFKHAITNYFEHHAKILILTDAGSEGLNLQFCNTVINYDLPWNPMKIEQRIGRCHRYGQKNTVVVMNFLNTINAADRRVYDILKRKFSLFEDVLGASDIAFGILDSGMDFEKRILEIYQTCNSKEEFKMAFDKLDRELDRKSRSKSVQLKDILQLETAEEKASIFADIMQEIKAYRSDVEKWEKVDGPGVPVRPARIACENYIKDNILGSQHGFILLGAFTDCKEVLAPALAAFDEGGNRLAMSESEILDLFEQLPRTPDFYYLNEQQTGDAFQKAVETLENELHQEYLKKAEGDIALYQKKMNNWMEIQKTQLDLAIHALSEDISTLNMECALAKEFLQKVDIKKKVKAKETERDKLQTEYHARVNGIEAEAAKEMEQYQKSVEITPLVIVKAIVKF